MKRIKRNDLVKIVAGAEKGRLAKVERVVGDKVYLEKVGLRERHFKSTQFNQGGKREIQVGLHISNVALVDDAEKPTRVAFAVKDGQKTRVAKTTGKELK